MMLSVTENKSGEEDEDSEQLIYQIYIAKKDVSTSTSGKDVVTNKINIDYKELFEMQRLISGQQKQIQEVESKYNDFLNSYQNIEISNETNLRI